MVIAMVAMWVVKVSIDEIVYMVAMGDCLMATTWPMDV